MKLHPLLSLGLMAAGAAAALRPLRRRAAWDRANRTAYLALDYDDVAEAASRANQSPGDLLHALWHAGATHVSVPEDTVARLMAEGRIGVAIPRQPLAELAPGSRWNYLAASETGLLERLQGELAERQPESRARLMDDEGRPLLAVAGNLQALLPMGLGFDPELAHLAAHAGLQPLPRPTSYPWPTAASIDRSLAQAAALAGADQQGPAIAAFQGTGTPGHPGELILGHEMLIQDTIASMKRHGLAFAYFAETRHQRGDWFVAKSIAPNVVLAHQFSQAELVPEDMHTAAHRWGLMAREKGIRLVYLHLFKVVHATTPLDSVDYVAAVADVLVNREGLCLAGRPDFRPEHVHHHHGHSHAHDHGHQHRHDEPAPNSAQTPNHDHGNDHDGESHRDQRDQYRDREPAHDTIDHSPEIIPNDHSQQPIGNSNPPNEHHPRFPVPNPQFPIPNSQSPIPYPQFSLPALPRDDRALPFIALIPAGAGALALSELLDLPDSIAVPLALAGLAAPLIVGRLDRPSNALEAAFRPSYAPKLIALGTTALAPLAAALAGYRGGPIGLAEAVAVEVLAAAGLAATVADQDYVLRIEELKSTQLGWIVPLAGVLAVTLAPAASALVGQKRQPDPLRVEIVAPQKPSIAATQRRDRAPDLVAALLPKPGQSKQWARGMAATLAEAATTLAIDQGSSLLRQRLPRIASPAAVWAFQQGSSYAQRKLLARLGGVGEFGGESDKFGESDEFDELDGSDFVASLPPQGQAVAATVAAAPPEPRPAQAMAWRLGLMAAAIGAGLVLAKSGWLPADPLAPLDVEHKTEHTHHLSRAQAAIGDASMAFSLQPLRKWTFPTLAVQSIAAFAPAPAAGLSAVVAALGEAAFLTGFRQAARPVERTVLDRIGLLTKR